MLPALMNSPRKGVGRPSVLLDMRPLQGPSSARGVGAYARGLLSGLIENGFDRNLTLLLDAAFDTPALPVGEYKLAGCRRRSHGQLAAYEDAVALAADIQRIGPDVYHAIDFHLPGQSPVPLVVTLHDLIPWAWGGSRMRGERVRYWIFRGSCGGPTSSWPFPRPQRRTPCGCVCLRANGSASCPRRRGRRLRLGRGRRNTSSTGGAWRSHTYCLWARWTPARIRRRCCARGRWPGIPTPSCS